MCLFFSSSGSGLLLSLQYLGHNLLFFDEKRANNTISHAAGTSGTTIGSVDGLQASGHSGPFSGTSWHNTVQLDLAAGVTALGKGSLLFNVLISESATWCFDDLSSVRAGAV